MAGCSARWPPHKSAVVQQAFRAAMHAMMFTSAGRRWQSRPLRVCAVPSCHFRHKTKGRPWPKGLERLVVLFSQAMLGEAAARPQRPASLILSQARTCCHLVVRLHSHHLASTESPDDPAGQIVLLPFGEA